MCPIYTAVSTNAKKMKNPILIVLLILVCLKAAIAQNSLTETEKLAATAKVWGFLKYYHPTVAAGKYNWDEELFRVLPKVKEISTREGLSRVYMDWLDGLGKVKECKGCSQNSNHDYFDDNFDLSWLDDGKVFTAGLSERLRFIERNRHQGKKFYVSSANVARNVIVTNEITYRGSDWSDARLRLLSLFRYWNIVEYFFPYKYQADTDWDVVLDRMIPEFLYAKNESDYHMAMLGLIVSVDDSHAGFSTDRTRAHFGLYWIPANFHLIDGKAVITGFYDEALAKKDDLRIGDAITKVNGRDVGTIFRENEKYINGSNIPKKMSNAYYTIFNGPSDSVRVEYTRGGVTSSKTIKRYLAGELKPGKQESEKFKILDGNIGYVNMGALETKDVAEAMGALNNTKAIIFDIRNYPKQTLYAVADYISSKSNDFYRVTYPDLDYPGRFIWKSGRQSGQSGELRYKGEVVLLANERTQSHAEFTVMCLQTGDNVTTIGSQTSGADGNVSTIEMVGGYKTVISGIGIFYPDRTETQRKGVRIDLEASPTIQGIIDGRDEVLERAIEFVNRK